MKFPMKTVSVGTYNALNVAMILNYLNTLVNVQKGKDSGNDYYNKIAQDMDSNKFGSGVIGAIKGVSVDQAAKAYGAGVQADFGVNNGDWLSLTKLPLNVYRKVNPNSVMFVEHDPEKYKDIQRVASMTYTMPEDRQRAWVKELGFDKMGSGRTRGSLGVVGARYTTVVDENGRRQYAPVFLMAGLDNNNRSVISWAKLVRKSDGSKSLRFVKSSDLDAYDDSLKSVKSVDASQYVDDNSDTGSILDDIAAGDIGSVADDINEAASSFRNYEKEINDRDAFINHLMMSEISPRIRGTYKKGE